MCKEICYEIELPNESDIKEVVNILDDIYNFMELNIKAGIASQSLGNTEKSKEIFEGMKLIGKKMDELAEALGGALKNISEVSDMVKANNEKEMRGDE